MKYVDDPPVRRYMMVRGDDLSQYWFDAYGWIACYFAQLEGLTYSVIGTLGTANEIARAIRLPFQARSEKASELVLRHFIARGEKPLGDEWVDFFAVAKSCAPMRNKILHNPLSVNLALGEQLNDSSAGISLVHERGRPILKLGSVQDFSAKLFDLNVRMQNLLAKSSFVPCCTKYDLEEGAIQRQN